MWPFNWLAKRRERKAEQARKNQAEIDQRIRSVVADREARGFGVSPPRPWPRSSPASITSPLHPIHHAGSSSSYSSDCSSSSDSGSGGGGGDGGGGSCGGD